MLFAPEEVEETHYDCELPVEYLILPTASAASRTAGSAPDSSGLYRGSSTPKVIHLACTEAHRPGKGILGVEVLVSRTFRCCSFDSANPFATPQLLPQQSLHETSK